MLLFVTHSHMMPWSDAVVACLPKPVPVMQWLCVVTIGRQDHHRLGTAPSCGNSCPLCCMEYYVYMEDYQCNFAPTPSYPSLACQVLASVKALRPGSEVCEAARGLSDPRRTSLLLLGKAGRGTPFHVDRTQAENICFPVVGKSKVRQTSTSQGMHSQFFTVLLILPVRFCLP